MRRRLSHISIGALLAVALVIAGCQTAGQSTGLGALIGAGAGAVIGHQSGHAAEGAAIGAVVGGLAGYAVHRYKSRQTRTAQQTWNDYNYQPEQGFKMDMRGGSVAPGTVKKGDSVTATFEYATLGTGPNGVNVEETCLLKKDGQQIAELDKKTVTRPDGTWENLIEFQVPKKAEAGHYAVAQRVSGAGQTLQKDLSFTVQTETAEAPDNHSRWFVIRTAAAR